MTDQPTSPDPEELQIPVQGDCGHHFLVPLARLDDGAEFACPVCGQTDRLDEAAVQATKEDLDRLAAEGKLDTVGFQVREHLSR